MTWFFPVSLDYLCTYDVPLFLPKATHFIGMHSHSVFLFSFTKTPSRLKVIGDEGWLWHRLSFFQIHVSLLCR